MDQTVEHNIHTYIHLLFIIREREGGQVGTKSKQVSLHYFFFLFSHTRRLRDKRSGHTYIDYLHTYIHTYRARGEERSGVGGEWEVNPGQLRSAPLHR